MRTKLFILLGLAASLLTSCADPNLVDCLKDDDCPFSYGCYKNTCRKGYYSELACNFSGVRCDKDNLAVEICIDEQRQTVEACAFGCANAKCKTDDYCDYKKPICRGLDVMQCLDNHETHIATCDMGCSDGECICTYTDKKCSDNNVVQCVNKTEKVVEKCAKGCKNGECIKSDNNNYNLVFYQLYPGGGNYKSTYKEKYVVLQNVSSTSFLASDIKLYYFSKSSYQSTSYCKLPDDITIKPGGFYLIVVNDGSESSAPSIPIKADYTCSYNMLPSRTDGSFLLGFNTPNKLDLQSEDKENYIIVDAVGYGEAGWFLGAAAESPNDTKALTRENCSVSMNNATDFTLTDPIPRNSMSSTGCHL